jgi:GT2 family glycosyltransferase
LKPIQVIVVVYRIPIAASPTYRTLRAAIGAHPALAETINLLVCDNSRTPQTPPDDFLGRYLHDGTNPGLAARYNQALSQAVADGATWLLLLDQDTELTVAYLDELVTLSTTLAADANIAAIVPKLMEGPHVRSPHLPVFRGGSSAIQPVDPAAHGPFDGLLRVFNSGALVRVAALQAIGGFPEAYWLDSLDHATFHRLQCRGGCIYIMEAQLEHEMSIHRPDKHRDPANAARHRNQLAAENLFYREHGSPAERIRHRLSLLIDALRSLRHGHPAEALRLLHAAFELPRPQSGPVWIFSGTGKTRAL